MYPTRDVYLHIKQCPWAKAMDLDKGDLVQFQYRENDGTPMVSRIIRLEEADGVPLKIKSKY